jgi:spore coat protein I
LKQSIDKALFSVNAQLYIKKSGGNVPEVILDRNGLPIVPYNEQLFVLYEWIDGNDLNFDNPSDLRHAVQGLARFHIASRGYAPDENCRVSTKLGKWPEQYSSMQKKLSDWKEAAGRENNQQNYSTYFRNADSMVNICKMAFNALEKSNYRILTTEGSNSIVLCHQDYGKGNAVATAKGVYVIDLDGVTFDLPSRDLRKIIGKQAENKGQWQTGTIGEIVSWYAEVNPLNQDERETLYIDLLYPHWFFGLVKNLFQNEKPLKMSEIERIARLEESKIPVIKALLKKE